MTTGLIGQPLPRVDGRAKVTGQARYAADFNQPGQAYAVMVGANVGLGRIASIDHDGPAAMPGVLGVISHRNAPRLPYAPHKSYIDPPVGERLHVLQDAQVHFYGQPIAVVIAETLDQAERAAAAIRVAYDAEQPIVGIDDPRAEPVAPTPVKAPGIRIHGERARGDADAGFAAATVRLDNSYEIARENHNPMEPHATIAAWQGERLTLWSKSQFVVNERAEIAAIFGLPPENIEVICPFIGGAFGTSLRTWPHVTIAALAARHVGRPVKLALTRRQMFFSTGHRPHTRQRLAIGAGADGKLGAIIHEALGETSRHEEFIEALTSATTYLYGCPNVRTRYRLQPLDTGSPNHMRGPGEASGIYALECAMDELSYALGTDPVELRRRNEPDIDEGEGKPFSSRSLTACYEAAAARFGWSRRAPQPRTMRDGRLLIGMGMAAATYPAFHSPASARVRLLAQGMAEVEVAASDMGPGTYTSVTQVAAETLGLPLDQVRLDIGRSTYPPAPPHGGSQTMASIGSAVRAACLAAQEEVLKRATADAGGPLFGAAPDQLVWRDGLLHRRDGDTAGRSYAELVFRAGAPVEAIGSSKRESDPARRYSMHAFGAIFVEVAVDPDVGTVRMRRAVGAYDIGRVVNPHLARSQCVGGMIGGIGMALMERTILDPRDGRPANAHMADYLLPVNLDVPPIEALFVETEDPHVNPLGVKGVGEIALVGMAPAIANAVFHATGKRLRNLPIRIEDILED